MINFSILSPKEFAVLRAHLLIKESTGSKAVARITGNSARTIEEHRRSIRGKLSKNLFKVFYDLGAHDAIRGSLQVREVRQGGVGRERAVRAVESEVAP